MTTRFVKIGKCSHCGFPKKIFYVENVGYFSECQGGCKIKMQEIATLSLKLGEQWRKIRKEVGI